MSIVFKFKQRKKENALWQDAEQGMTITLDENIKYLLKFEQTITLQYQKEISAAGGERLDRNLFALHINNFVGHFILAGVTVNVRSRKFSESTLSKMLEEVSEKSTSLLFGWATPTNIHSQCNSLKHNPVPYHQLQLLRQVLLRNEVGNRLQDYIAITEMNPTSEFERHRKPVHLAQVKHIDSRAIQHILSHPEKLARLQAGAPLCGTDLAEKLTFGTPESQHVPVEVWQSCRQLSFDTFENRFIKRVLEDCTSLVHRFVEHKKLHKSMREDCRQMLVILAELNDVPFLKNVTHLTNFDMPSQALFKAEGYRDVYHFWMRLIQHRSLPLDDLETTQLLEGKNIALLYEYWVFIRVLSAIEQETKHKPLSKLSVLRNELGDSLKHNLSVMYGDDITVRFNQSYTRSSKTAYSTPLRPDVIIQIKDHIYVVDAKYKLRSLNISENFDDKGQQESAYVRADLYKMHAYKDAIYGVKGAFIAYPGTLFSFFSSTGAFVNSPSEIKKIDGVGAIALQPGNKTDDLQVLVKKIFQDAGYKYI
ncbi:TPA: DUF2357 domain-containing protein [Photobacterium damselae]